MVGEFYESYKIDEISTRLIAPVTANELLQWPLLHGTLAACEAHVHDNIQATGLRSNVGNPNSNEQDKALGRTDYVFVAPGGFKINYGMGQWGILIDPVVLDVPGVICSGRDVVSAYECLQMALEGDGEHYCGHAWEPTALLEIAAKYPMNPLDNVRDRFLMKNHLGRVLQTEEFGRHYQEHYLHTPTRLYASIEKNARGRTLFQYFNRTGVWGLSEEVMIPKEIEPQYLLGYWNNGKFSQWNQATSPATQDRLEVWVNTLMKLQNRI